MLWVQPQKRKKKKKIKTAKMTSSGDSHLPCEWLCLDVEVTFPSSALTLHQHSKQNLVLLKDLKGSFINCPGHSVLDSTLRKEIRRDSRTSPVA